MAEKKQQKPPVVLDDVFFHVSQVKVGTVLTYMGRLDPRSQWKVAGIDTYSTSRGRIEAKRASQAQHLSDLLTLRRIGGPGRKAEERRLTFSYCSYSAIWRLPQPQAMPEAAE